MIYILILLIIFLLFDKDDFKNNIKNIYGEPLQKCQINNDDMDGSWDNEGYCSEIDKGVHQICFNVSDSTKNFARDTHQKDNWSLKRNNNNHCMCLGAWSLYKAKQNKNKIKKTNNELICESIPEMSLSDKYVNKWNRWNGNELPNQIVDGVNSLYEQCYEKGNYKQKKYLNNKYIDLTKNKKEFHYTDIYINANKM